MFAHASEQRRSLALSLAVFVLIATFAAKLLDSSSQFDRDVRNFLLQNAALVESAGRLRSQVGKAWFEVLAKLFVRFYDCFFVVAGMVSILLDIVEKTINEQKCSKGMRADVVKLTR